MSPVATSTCERVSIAFVHSFVTPPISASIARVITAGRSPEMKYAMSASPKVIAGHGVSTKKLCSGLRPYCTTKFPIGLVMWKTNVCGFCT